MAKQSIEKVIKKIKKATLDPRKKEIKFLKNLYGDFKSTFGEAFGDVGDFFKKHKLLVILAFLAFLYYRNKQFTIANFVKKLEDRIKGTAREEDW